MIKVKFLKSVSILLLIMTSSGCGTIKSIFPDKEKDYQFRSEIPELVVPEDLTDHGINYQNKIGPSRQPSNNKQIPVEQKTKPVYVERVIYDGGATRLRIDQTFSHSWRLVGKALARKSIEIVARNKPDGLFIVMFDPAEQKVTDDSIWDEILFIFGQQNGNEQEYRIRLADYENYTEVIVLDKNDKPTSYGPGLDLLQLLQDTIESDSEEKTK